METNEEQISPIEEEQVEEIAQVEQLPVVIVETSQEEVKPPQFQLTPPVTKKKPRNIPRFARGRD